MNPWRLTRDQRCSEPLPRPCVFPSTATLSLEMKHCGGGGTRTHGSDALPVSTCTLFMLRSRHSAGSHRPLRDKALFGSRHWPHSWHGGTCFRQRSLSFARLLVRPVLPRPRSFPCSLRPGYVNHRLSCRQLQYRVQLEKFTSTTRRSSCTRRESSSGWRACRPARRR